MVVRPRELLDMRLDLLSHCCRRLVDGAQMLIYRAWANGLAAPIAYTNPHLEFHVGGDPTGHWGWDFNVCNALVVCYNLIDLGGLF